MYLLICNFWIQAFCLPVIQVVYETIQDALLGKKPGKVLIEDEGILIKLTLSLYGIKGVPLRRTTVPLSKFTNTGFCQFLEFSVLEKAWKMNVYDRDSLFGKSHICMVWRGNPIKHRIISVWTLRLFSRHGFLCIILNVRLISASKGQQLTLQTVISSPTFSGLP